MRTIQHTIGPFSVIRQRSYNQAMFKFTPANKKVAAVPTHTVGNVAKYLGTMNKLSGLGAITALAVFSLLVYCLGTFFGPPPSFTSVSVNSGGANDNSNDKPADIFHPRPLRATSG